MEKVQLERLQKDEEKLNLFINKLKLKKQYHRLKLILEKRDYLRDRIATAEAFSN